MKYKIVENSFFARIARLVLKSPDVAMVLGKTIHLSGVDKATFLRNEQWVAHEACHIRQFEEHGFMRFLWLYLIESCRKGYVNNRFEVEARLAAGQPDCRHQKKKTTPVPEPLPPNPGRQA